MPDKKVTYRIDENMLRKTLLGYSVEVDAERCNAIEADASALRMQKSIALPSTAALIKFVAIPLVLIVSCVLVYANMDAIQDAFTPTPEVKVAPAKQISVKHAAVKPPVITAAKVVPPPQENSTVKAKKEEVAIPEFKAPDSAKKQNNKQAMPVVAAPPSDTVTQPKTEELAKSNKPDTASHKADAPVKKKKKRRRRSNGLDDLKESTLQPNSAEDDVVVPQ
ncbi:MAG: hypothetical protein ACXVC6_02245 [Bacteroidia bacterium]